MAITQSTQRVIQVAATGTRGQAGGTNGNFNSRLDDSKIVEAAVEYAFIDLVIPADQAQGSTVELWEFPPGTMIFPELCSVIVSDDVSSGAVTVDVGDVVDVDRYCDGASIASTGEVSFITPAFPDAYFNRYEMVQTNITSTNTTLVILTFATLAATVETGGIRVKLAYKVLQP